MQSHGGDNLAGYLIAANRHSKRFIDERRGPSEVEGLVGSFEGRHKCRVKCKSHEEDCDQGGGQSPMELQRSMHAPIPVRQEDSDSLIPGGVGSPADCFL
jgi:hypothetical protein